MKQRLGSPRTINISKQVGQPAAALSLLSFLLSRSLARAEADGAACRHRRSHQALAPQWRPPARQSAASALL